jgi:hypothetical protein
MARPVIWIVVALCSYVLGSAQAVRAPKIWNDAELAEWATPVAGLNVRPAHYSEAEYYALPPDNYKTYPFYPVDREPPGYWEWLQKQKPQSLVDVDEVRSDEDWIATGKRAFFELDAWLLRTDDPALMARARDPESLRSVRTLADGSLVPLRWVVTPEGLMLSAPACGGCHVPARLREPRSDSSVRSIDGDPVQPRLGRLAGAGGTVRRLQNFYAGDPTPIALWKEFSVPWAADDRVERFRSMAPEEFRSLRTTLGLGRSFVNGVFARANGSPYYTTKIPDLHDLRYSRYLDATATHRLRGPEDIARYAALVTGADRMDFGPHRILSDEQRRLRVRYADEVLYAIGMYLMSLEPRKNPSPPAAPIVERGRRIFERQNCSRCHPAPTYTTGKLTLAEGWAPPEDHPYRHDILPISVRTDPGAALKTRKGTGLYKIPSLRGVWSRNLLLHDGSLTSLEELFDLKRLQPSYEPKGWSPPGVTKRAIRGHEFGLRLSSEERAALIAFLRSL